MKWKFAGTERLTMRSRLNVAHRSTKDQTPPVLLLAANTTTLRCCLTWTKKSKEEALRKMGKKKKKSGSSGHFGHKTPRKMDACSESAASSTVQQTKASAGNNKTFGGRATDRGNVFLFSQLSKDCELVCSVATSATQQKMLFHPTPGKSLHALFLSSFSCRAMSAVFCSHSVHLFHLKQTAGTNNGSSS
jgi:hypothetical protein